MTAKVLGGRAGIGWLSRRVDRNGKQLDGYVDEIMPLGDLEAKFSAFGWNVVTVDGHNVEALYHAIVRTEYPDRAIDCGIQEENMIGVAVGMSAEGRKPYCHTFGAFASRWCFDQVFLSVGYARNSVRIIGSDPGICAMYNGGTHMPFEDVVAAYAKKMLCCGNLRKFQYTRGHFWGCGRIPGCQSPGSS